MIKKFKVVMFLIFVAFMIVGQNSLCAEIGDVNIDGTFISMSGKVDSGISGEQVTLVMLKPGVTVTDINGVVSDYSQLKQYIQCIEQTETGDGGYYSFLLQLPDNAQTANYALRLSGEGFSNVLQKNIRYAKSSELLTALNTINGITNASDMRTYIESNFMYLMLDLNDYNVLPQTGGVRETVCAALIGRAFDTANLANGARDADSAFSGTLGLKLFQLEKNTDNLDNYLKKYAGYMGIDLTEYNSLADNGQQFVCGGIFQHKFSDIPSLKATLSAWIAVFNTNQSTNWSQIESIVMKHKDALGISSSLFNGFSATNIEDVFKEAAKNKPFADPDALKTACENAVLIINSALQNVTNTDRSKGSSVGSVNYQANTPLITPDVPIQESKADEFADVQWAKPYFDFLKERGIVKGYSDGTFKPNMAISREEFVKLVVLSFGILDETAETEFADVSNDEWYYRYIASAVKFGLVNGIGDGRFGVGNPISRQDIVTIVYRALKNDLLQLDIFSGESGFIDNEEIDNYAKEGVNALFSAGIISGMSDGSFSPKTFATRAQSVKIICMILELNDKQ